MALEDLEPILPRFTGSDPDSWISQSELYFRFYSIYGDDRFSYVIEVFEDGPFYWFNSWFRSDDLTWNDFINAMITQFHANSADPFAIEACSIHQTQAIIDLIQEPYLFDSKFDDVNSIVTPSFTFGSTDSVITTTALQVFDEMPDSIVTEIDSADNQTIDFAVLSIQTEIIVVVNESYGVKDAPINILDYLVVIERVILDYYVDSLVMNSFAWNPGLLAHHVPVSFMTFGFDPGPNFLNTSYSTRIIKRFDPVVVVLFESSNSLLEPTPAIVQKLAPSTHVNISIQMTYAPGGIWGDKMDGNNDQELMLNRNASVCITQELRNLLTKLCFTHRIFDIWAILHDQMLYIDVFVRTKEILLHVLKMEFGCYTTVYNDFLDVFLGKSTEWQAGKQVMHMFGSRGNRFVAMWGHTVVPMHPQVGHTRFGWYGGTRNLLCSMVDQAIEQTQSVNEYLCLALPTRHGPPQLLNLSAHVSQAFQVMLTASGETRGHLQWAQFLYITAVYCWQLCGDWMGSKIPEGKVFYNPHNRWKTYGLLEASSNQVTNSVNEGVSCTVKNLQCISWSPGMQVAKDVVRYATNLNLMELCTYMLGNKGPFIDALSLSNSLGIQIQAWIGSTSARVSVLFGWGITHSLVTTWLANFLLFNIEPTVPFSIVQGHWACLSHTGNTPQVATPHLLQVWMFLRWVLLEKQELCFFVLSLVNAIEKRPDLYRYHAGHVVGLHHLAQTDPFSDSFLLQLLVETIGQPFDEPALGTNGSDPTYASFSHGTVNFVFPQDRFVIWLIPWFYVVVGLVNHPLIVLITCSGTILLGFHWEIESNSGNQLTNNVGMFLHIIKSSSLLAGINPDDLVAITMGIYCIRSHFPPVENYTPTSLATVVLTNNVLVAACVTYVDFIKPYYMLLKFHLLKPNNFTSEFPHYERYFWTTTNLPRFSRITGGAMQHAATIHTITHFAALFGHMPPEIACYTHNSLDSAKLLPASVHSCHYPHFHTQLIVHLVSVTRPFGSLYGHTPPNIFGSFRNPIGKATSEAHMLESADIPPIFSNHFILAHNRIKTKQVGTWGSVAGFLNSFTHLHLADKVVLNGGSNVVNLMDLNQGTQLGSPAQEAQQVKGMVRGSSQQVIRKDMKGVGVRNEIC